MTQHKMIFINLLNNNSLDQVAKAYHLSPEEIDNSFRFVIKKIKSYCFERAYPYIACDTLTEARRNKKVLLHILDRININAEPRFNKIVTHAGLGANDLQNALFTRVK